MVASLENHTCYIQPMKKSKPGRKFKNLFYDIETYTAEGSNAFIPCLLVSIMTCYICENIEALDHSCDFCGPKRLMTFFPDANEPHNLIQRFIHYAMAQQKDSTPIYIIGHNSSKFDASFIFRELLLEGLTLITEAPIRRGTSIMSLKLGSIMFRDSYLFSPVKLRKFPELFNLSTDIRKGMFPYRFIKSEADIDYKGNFPSEDYFELADLSNKELNEYKAYKKSFENKPWSARDELLSYCIDDVKILWLGFTKFRQGYIKNFQIDPIESNITLAGLCIQVYTSTFMPKNVLGLIDDKPQRKWFSPISLVYLGWLQQSGQIPVDCDIITARTGVRGEIFIKGPHKNNLYLDGYYKTHAGETVAIEYNSCYYHSHFCPEGKNSSAPINGKPAHINRQETDNRIKFLESKLSKVIVMWDCVFRKEMKNNPLLKAFYDKFIRSYKELRLKIRDGLYGGRTSAYRLIYECSLYEQILYVDFVSMYPAIQCKFKFPVKQPTRLVGFTLPTVEHFCTNIDDYLGMARIEVLPPDNLHIGVLPVRIGGTLVFPLCKTCAEFKQEVCNHTMKQKSLIGTWCTPEIKLAINRGYRILYIFEIMYFKEQQYIFKDYIDYFFKQKVHASGYPERVKTEQDKDQYIADYKTKMNIDLEKDKIKLDPPARLTSKLNLNSLWGRLGMQSSNKDKYALVNSPEEMHEFLSDQQFKVSDIMCGSEKALVRYKQTEVAQTKIPKAVNSVVAAFVTCYGRLMLYELMEKAGNNLVYGDTDSCMIITRRSGYVPSPDFVWPPHLQKPLDLEMGEYLGMLTDEVAEKYGSDYVATRFVSPCAKTYSLAIENVQEQGNKQNI